MGLKFNLETEFDYLFQIQKTAFITPQTKSDGKHWHPMPAASRIYDSFIAFISPFYLLIFFTQRGCKVFNDFEIVILFIELSLCSVKHKGGPKMKCCLPYFIDIGQDASQDLLHIFQNQNLH